MDGFITHRLDETGIEKAKAELNEIPDERDGAVETFRSWIQDQKWLKTPTDQCFLLLFLRARKFSQLGARELLENFWRMRGSVPEWISNLDPCDPNIQHLIDRGSLLLLPGRDKYGRSVVLRNTGTFDEACYTNEKTGQHFLRLVWCIVHYFVLDENFQVHGLLYFADMTYYSHKEQTLLKGMDNLRKLINSLQNHFPARFKGVYLYNVGPVYDALVTLFMSFMKEKLRSRVKLFNTMVDVYEVIPLSELPKEYLPDDYVGPCAGTMKDIIEYTKKELSRPELRSFLNYLDSEEYGVDDSLKPKDIPSESFRKLKTESIMKRGFPTQAPNF